MCDSFRLLFGQRAIQWHQAQRAEFITGCHACNRTWLTELLGECGALVVTVTRPPLHAICELSLVEHGLQACRSNHLLPTGVIQVEVAIGVLQMHPSERHLHLHTIYVNRVIR